MKFLIDTGASSSFINPEYTQPEDLIETTPTVITTILNKHILNKKIILPNFIEFNSPGELTFLVFQFHNYFDGLLGLDALTQLEAKVDLANQLLITRNSTIPIQFKPNFMSQKYTIPPNSKFITKLPVDIRNGDIFIPSTEFKPGLYTSEGIYKSNDWYSIVEVINSHNYEQTLLVEQPIKVTKISSTEVCELNNINIEYNNQIPNERLNTDITQLVRVDHLNFEERRMILKICREYDDIFLKEGQKLTFTNVVKHSIPTIEDVPIYTKSYRYPYVHKEEVRNQITDMLNQGIIRPSYSPWSSPVWIVPKKKRCQWETKMAFGNRLS